MCLQTVLKSGSQMPAKRHDIPIEGRSRPLSTNQLMEWMACDWPDPHYRLLATLPIVSGLKHSELHHFDTDNWLVESSNPPAIVVPPQLPCRAGSDGDICYDCKTYRDGVWETRHSSQPRRIPLHDPQIHNFLDSYASLYDLPMERGRFKRHATQLAEVSPLDREVSITALRYTFGIILAAKGHEDEEVRQFLGFGKESTHPIGCRKLADWKRYDGLEAFGTGEFRE